MGLFTNGLLIRPDDTELLEVLLRLEYIHLSLDAGCNATYVSTKRPAAPMQKPYRHVLNVLERLALERWPEKQPRLNVGFVVTSENHREMLKATADVYRVGADGIRFKLDLLAQKDARLQACRENIERQLQMANERFCWLPAFSVSRVFNDVWTTKSSAREGRDCPFAHFHGTVGADGKAYLCDHNAGLPTVPLGDALRQGTADFWSATSTCGTDKAGRCMSCVCPPSAAALNLFLRACRSAVRTYGYRPALRALGYLRNESQRALLSARCDLG